MDNMNNTMFYFHYFETINSTNTFLKQLQTLENDPRIHCCIADFQTEGRGRFGKTWHSPKQDNIYLSLKLPMRVADIPHAGLSLAVSLWVLGALKQFEPDVALSLKWPNDILWQHKKLSGILIEIGPDNRPIIGIGVNLNGVLPAPPDLKKPWCTLHEITQKHYDKNALIDTILSQIKSNLPDFLEKGLNVEQWSGYDVLKDRFIEVFQANHPLQGYARSITKTGQLILEDQTGKIHFLYSGETTILNSSLVSDQND